MNVEPRTLNTQPSAWPHRLAMLLCCATFPLVWVGGLVTTYKAGMAFPDWPTSNGYFLFFYPWLDWLRGPWEMFVEHGHRMIAATVGLLTIGLCISMWQTHQPKWLRRLGLIALAAVIFQGLLGGMRVLFDERTLAMIHGCVGPAFFALTAAIAVVTSRWWRENRNRLDAGSAGALPLMAAITAVLAYTQLVLGAQVRHFRPEGTPTLYHTFLMFHIVVALALTAYVFSVWFAFIRKARHIRQLIVPACLLTGLVVLQLALGAATWIYKYNWPAFMGDSEVASVFTVQAMGWRQAQITTAHVAVGSLILATSVLLSLSTMRMVGSRAISWSMVRQSSNEKRVGGKNMTEAAL